MPSHSLFKKKNKCDALVTKSVLCFVIKSVLFLSSIGQVLKQWIDLLQYRQAGVATLAIAIVVAALDYISAKTREKLV